MRQTIVTLALVSALLSAPDAGATDLWIHQIGGTGGSAQASGGPDLSFTLGGTAPGAAASPEADGYFGFWILPGGFQVPVAVDDGGPPLAAALFQNYPNPIHTSTTVPFRVGGADKDGGPTPVRLEIFDVAGRRVATLVDDLRAPGNHQVTWDGRDHAGRTVASGVYFARFTTDTVNQTVRMLRVR
jgi:hypothetical protein